MSKHKSVSGHFIPINYLETKNKLVTIVNELQIYGGNMNKSLILTMLITLSLLMSGCNGASYQSLMEDLSSESDPEKVYKELKQAELEDAEDVVRLQASLVRFSLKTQSASFISEAKKLLDVVDESAIDLSASDHAVQTYVYLAALSNKNKSYNRKIDSRIIETIDELCLPSNKLAYKMEDIDKLSDTYYQHHLAQACQAIFQDRSAARDISLAIVIKQEDCTFSGQTSRSFVSEILECRLQRAGINITGMLPNKEEQ